MNLSQVFGLYPDSAGAIQSLLEAAIGRAPPLEATDHLGVVNRLWTVTNQQVVSAVIGQMGPLPIFIADGHHRYETGRRYLEERRSAGEVRDAQAAPNFILMMLVSMHDPGLVILPTHRLVSSIPELSAEQLRSVVGSHFRMETVGQGAEAARAAWELMAAAGSQNVLGFGTVSDGVWQLGHYTSQEALDELAPDHSPSWRGLAVSILHVLVLGRLLPRRVGGQPQCRYVHLIQEVTDAVAGRQCQLAVLVPPATIEHVEQIAGQREKMPPKSTYFYPKLLSGLVLNSLRKD
jgi:uncharacterized protein (DUF1015 family)